jgi:hypothetical protein
MDAADHEQAVDPHRGGAGDVGAQRLADGERARRQRRNAARGRCRGERGIVDRAVRLAGIEHVAAGAAVEIGDRSSLTQVSQCELDDEIRVGAQHEQLAPAHGLDHRAIVVRRLRRIVEQAGADDVVGRLHRDEPHVEAVKDRRSRSGPMWNTRAAGRDLGAVTSPDDATPS